MPGTTAGRVFVATRFSCLATLAERGSFREVWRPPFIDRIAAEDRGHINGMAIAGDRPKFVTCVSQTNIAACARALEEMKTPKEVDRAAFHYHRAVVLAGGNTGPRAKAVAGVHHSMGRFRLEAGDAPRALEALRQASMAGRLAPAEFSGDDLAEILIDLADALLRLGLTDDAHRVLEKASQAEGEAALVRLAQLSYRFNLWQEAVEILRRNVALRPESGTAHLNLADMLVKSWQLEEALAELERAEAIGQVLGAASAAIRATCASRMGDADTAIRLYQQLVDAGNAGLRSNVAMSALYSDTQTPQEVADRHRRLFAPLGIGARSRPWASAPGRATASATTATLTDLCGSAW